MATRQKEELSKKYRIVPYFNLEVSFFYTYSYFLLKVDVLHLHVIVFSTGNFSTNAMNNGCEDCDVFKNVLCQYLMKSKATYNFELTSSLLDRCMYRKF